MAMFIVIVAGWATAGLRELATEIWRSILGLGDFLDRRILRRQYKYIYLYPLPNGFFRLIQNLIITFWILKLFRLLVIYPFPYSPSSTWLLPLSSADQCGVKILPSRPYDETYSSPRCSHA